MFDSTSRLDKYVNILHRITWNGTVNKCDKKQFNMGKGHCNLDYDPAQIWDFLNIS